MSLRTYLVGLLLAASLSTYACDGCGGGASGNFQGVIPLFGQNQFAFRVNAFSSTHPTAAFSSTLPPSIILEDHFLQHEFTFRKFSSKKIIYSASVPLGINTRVETARTTQIKGIGDIQLGASRILINTSDSSFRTVKHILTIGLGLALPTGKYMQRDETMLRLPASFQLGKGAYAYNFNLYYVLRRNNLGIALNGQERVYSANELNYKFGNYTALSAVAFYRLNFESQRLTLLPQLGIGNENQEKDYSYGVAEYSTGGNQTWANLAIDVYRGRWAYGVNFQQKIQSNIPVGEAESFTRYGVQVTYRLSSYK
jgi:hypothetical protein